MKCPLETREGEILLSYCSHTLNGDDMHRLDEHLQSCVACRDFVHGQAELWEALDGWDAAPVSADFDHRLYARMEREISWWQRLWGRMGAPLVYRALPVTAIAALLVVGAWLNWRSPRAAPERQTTAQVERLQPDQVVNALDEMEVLDQFNHMIKPEGSTPRM